MDWINARSMGAPKPRQELSFKRDNKVSEIVGKDVAANDPRLLKLVVKWKQSKNEDFEDHFMSNPRFIEELKKTFA